VSTHADTVQQQFDPRSRAYLDSAVHASGPDLAHAERWLQKRGEARTAIDVGCGAGHLAFAMARHLHEVIASDPSPGMLATVADSARSRGLVNLSVSQAPAEKLPFGDDSFDLAGTRYSAHHWLELAPALAETRRVLRPGGALLVIDLLGDDRPLVDTHLQAMEVLRDPSHVRNRTAAQWHAAIEAAGFGVQEFARHPVRLDFAAWIARMRTPPEAEAAIRRLQRGAPTQVARALSLEEDGSFTVDTGVIVATPLNAQRCVAG